MMLIMLMIVIKKVLILRENFIKLERLNIFLEFIKKFFNVNSM